MCSPRQRLERCVEPGPKIGGGANARAESLETYRFTSSAGVVSDFNKFVCLGVPATRQVDGWTLRGRGGGVRRGGSVASSGLQDLKREAIHKGGVAEVEVRSE